jgi:hypothetical protein
MRAKPHCGKVGCSSTRFPTPIEHGDSNIAERMLPVLHPVQAIAFDFSGSPAASSPIWLSNRRETSGAYTRKR